MGNQVTYFGQLPTDIGVTMLEYQSTAGNVWEISSGVISGLASPNYFTMLFEVPLVGYSFLVENEISKTGDELLVQVAGPNAALTNASTTANVFCLNRIIDRACPFVLKQGTSPTSVLSATNTGGDYMIPGVSQGNQFSASVATTGRILVLVPGAKYAWKVTALGSSTKISFKYLLANILPKTP